MRPSKLSVASTLMTSFLVLAGCNSITGQFAVQSLCDRSSGATSWSQIGSGTTADPYLLCTPAQFASIGKDPTSWNKNFALAANLDFAKYDGSTADLSVRSIGTYDYVTAGNIVPFTGTFDGRSFTISNLKLVALPNQGIAPFGYTTGATISNLKLTGIDYSGSNYIAGVVAYNKSSLLHDISVQGKLTGSSDRIAGLASTNDGSGAGADASISRVVTNVAISATGPSGGLGGLITVNTAQLGGRADITDSSAIGSITMPTAGDTCGGLVAYNIASAGGSAKITNSFTSGTITLSDKGSYSAAFVGTNGGDGAGTDVSIHHSYTTASFTTTAQGGLVGGLIGANNCANGANCSVYQSYANGSVTISSHYTGQTGVGLLIGAASVSSGANISITDSYASGTINVQATGVGRVAGLVGNYNTSAGNPVVVQRSYSSVTITAVSPGAGYGSLFGFINNVPALTVTDTYWNGDLNAAGSGTAVTGITSKTASAMLLKSTFTNWDFVSVWKIDDGVSLPDLR